MKKKSSGKLLSLDKSSMWCERYDDIFMGPLPLKAVSLANVVGIRTEKVSALTPQQGL